MTLGVPKELVEFGKKELSKGFNMMLKKNEVLYKYNNKKIARKAFEDGEKIIIIAHKIKPSSPWNLELEIQKDAIANHVTMQTYATIGFNRFIEMFEEANCNFENGYYCAYYVKVCNNL